MEVTCKRNHTVLVLLLDTNIKMCMWYGYAEARIITAYLILLLLEPSGVY